MSEKMKAALLTLREDLQDELENDARFSTQKHVTLVTSRIKIIDEALQADAFEDAGKEALSVTDIVEQSLASAVVDGVFVQVVREADGPTTIIIHPNSDK